MLKKDDADIVQILQKGIPNDLLVHLPNKFGSILHKVALKP